jgi:hypothetical protein
VGRRIWVYVPESVRPTEDGGTYTLPEHTYDCRVLSFKGFFAADSEARVGMTARKKHLIQLWTDPGGMRTLTVGSIKLKDPKRVAAGFAREDARRAEEDDD